MTAGLVAALVSLQSHGSGLDPDERVRLEPTAAALDERTRQWQVPIRFVVFEPEEHDPMRAAALEPLRECIGLKPGTPDAARFEQRARLFLVDHERRQHVNLDVGDLHHRLGPTAADGCCETIVQVPAELAAKLAKDGKLPLSIGRDGDPTGARGHTWLVPPDGLSVVSDLDDTIKVTHVADRRAMLANTFLEEFEAVPGMAELYQRIAHSRAAPTELVAFHYVSLSPWQLAPVIESFLDERGFPGGSLHLQPFRLQDGDLGGLTGNSLEKKLAAIEPLLAKWPRRRFVLIGDSGQSDPEACGELARRHPAQIERVLIRDPHGPASDDSKEGAATRSTARYAKAFAGLEQNQWEVFDDPAKVAVAKEE